ncbi:MAG: hemerythrin domain-containing protein [Deltaproteobacteria bacterium]|nr:hemerythrin domain-containing protein [Deltaproteobacteria bacterium]
MPKTRRGFLTLAGAALMVAGLPAIAPVAAKEELQETEISPAEDLMREHGILRRLLLIYDEVLRRMDKNTETPAEVISGSAGIVRRFIENYHEKLEEEEVFPRFNKAGRLTGLVKVLYGQHQAGRRLTDEILRTSSASALGIGQPRHELVESLERFIRMYRPHAAREDTVLFPSFRTILTAKEYDQLGEKFEDKEMELFGKGGFEKIVEEVAELERKLGVYDLAQFTP